MSTGAHSPLKLIGVGILALGLAGVLTHDWMTKPVLTEADLTRLNGTVTHAKSQGGKRAYLEIGLSGQPLPFRCFSDAYPGKFADGSSTRLDPGTPVSIGVATTEMTSPRRNWLENEQFHQFVTLTIQGRDALRLEAHNEVVLSNRRAAPWFGSGLAMVGVFLIGTGLRQRWH